MDENNNTVPLNNLGGQQSTEKGIGAKIGIAIIVIILIAGAVFFFLSKKDAVNTADEQSTENVVTDPENATNEEFMKDLDSSVDVDLGANLMDLDNK